MKKIVLQFIALALITLFCCSCEDNSSGKYPYDTIRFYAENNVQSYQQKITIKGGNLNGTITVIGDIDTSPKIIFVNEQNTAQEIKDIQICMIPNTVYDNIQYFVIFNKYIFLS